MRVDFTDFNQADTVIQSRFAKEWSEFEAVLSDMPLHIKASDQAKKQGKPIFDAVGTNEYIKSTLSRYTWQVNVPIPKEYVFLGVDIDFFKSGIIAEVQFSNYPFLLNNLLRSELFYKAKVFFAGQPPDLLIVVSKAYMFPASNSTLYYEQAINQIKALSENKVFDIPIRVVGLFAQRNVVVKAKWTEYHTTRYSRTVLSRIDKDCTVIPGKRANNRCSILLS